MESCLTDIYGFTDIPKYLDDDAFFDKIDDMLVADIDMDMFDKVGILETDDSTTRMSTPLAQSITSPIINPDDFLNDVDGDELLGTSSDRSSPSFSNSPSSSSTNSFDHSKDSSSDESINVECTQTFQNYMQPTMVSPAPIFQPQTCPIRILQGTLIPVSAIKLEATPATVTTAQPLVLATNSNYARSKRNKVVLPKVNSQPGRKGFSSNQTPSMMDPVNEQAFRKQQRMIKNRESASLSRNKKREYMVSLETQVQSLLAENNVLKNENNNLKAQISNMLATCQCRVAQYSYFTKKISSPSRKNAVILLAMVFMVSFSFGNLNSLLYRKTTEPSVLDQLANDHVGRNLLWSDDYVSTEDDSSLVNITKTIKCQSILNQTENSRIEVDLRNWIGVNKESNASYNEDDMLDFMSGFHNMLKPGVNGLQRNAFKRKNPFFSHDWLEARKRRLSGQQVHRNQRLKNQIQLFYPTRRSRKFSKLFEKIGRRDDTFYVLSFNHDHLLLSAANHNKSTRPRMSFVLPADDSTQGGKVTLMQIDCEVMNTSVIELKKEHIPEHLRGSTVNRSDTREIRRNATRSFDVPNKHDIFSVADSSSRVDRRQHDINKVYKPYFIEEPGFGKEPRGEFSELFLT